MWAKCGWIAGTLCAILYATVNSQAAILINSGSNIQTFDSAPGVGEWATSNISGSSTLYNNNSSDITALDAAVNLRTAASINSTIATNTAYNSANNGQYFSGTLFTRTTGVAANMLMATLQNNTGGTVNSLDISYDLTMNPTGAVTEQVFEGHRLYYSLTGAANSWTVIGNRGFNNPIVTQAQTASLSSLGWTAGSALYLMWVDDNNDGTDNAYILDNVNFAVAPVPEPTSLAIAMLGLAGLVTARRFRRV